jgi:hypothetical protein
MRDAYRRGDELGARVGRLRIVAGHQRHDHKCLQFGTHRSASTGGSHTPSAADDVTGSSQARGGRVQQAQEKMREGRDAVEGQVRETDRASAGTG